MACPLNQAHKENYYQTLMEVDYQTLKGEVDYQILMEAVDYQILMEAEDYQILKEEAHCWAPQVALRALMLLAEPVFDPRPASE